LEEITKLSIHFLDNVITVNNYPLPVIADMVQNNRKIGLGVMGWADMLMKLGLSYNSEEGTKLAYQVMEFIDYHSKIESLELAKSRGAFNNFKGSVYESGTFLTKKFTGKSAGLITDAQWAELEAQIKEFGIRNATTTCIAPTGTISMIASAAGGVEPLFGLVFSRNVMDGTEMLEINPIFEKYAKENGIYSQELMKEIAQDGSIAHVDGVSNEIKHIFATAHDVTPVWHVKMQAAFQLHTDNAVSKTVNFEESATREDIEKAYILAFENNLKGITVYRNNSRTFQPMNLEAKKSPELEIKPVAAEEPTGEIKNVVCPDCGMTIQMAEGCFICLGCGHSGCS
jgi:ribonucleoside-diphosphate reductase alpha chain